MRIASVSRVIPALLTRMCSAPCCFDDGIDRSLQRRTVVDIEHDSAAAVCGQRLADVQTLPRHWWPCR